MLKNIYLNLIPVFLLLAILFSCQQENNIVKVTNPSSFQRDNETISVQLKDLKVSSGQLMVLELKTGDEIVSQLVDINQDSIFDEIIFQSGFLANETKKFLIKEGASGLAPKRKTFARFVPERIDDFAWENDRVAFRVYGPKAQKLALEGKKNGTLSSGVDCWLKKVDYPIINNWYAGFVKQKGYYHKDHGEGLDNYHVGPGRGCGGTGVMMDGELISSLNYTDYNMLTKGPIKTEFELKYAPYNAGNKVVTEQKTASIVLGENLTKFTIQVSGTDTLTTGITLHDNMGITSVDSSACWMSYWSPHFGEELGTSIVTHPKYFVGYSKIESNVKDKSHILMHLKVIDGMVEFYSGFTWSGSRQFPGKEEWEGYLNKFSKGMKSNHLVIEL